MPRPFAQLILMDALAPPAGQATRSALTGLETLLRLVDYIDAAFAAHDLTVTMALLERTERVTDLHRSSP